MTLFDVTVVVVTYHSAHCISGLATALGNVPNVIFVDNASTDDTVVMVKELLPQAQCIVNKNNIGFGAANNIALRQIKTRYALLLNPDCVPEVGFVESLLSVAQQYPSAAVIAPHLLRRSNEIEISYRWPNLLWRSKGGGAEGPCCVGFVCGAVMLCKMASLKEIGFFDEDFFLYYEDEDICQRLFNLRREIILAPYIKVKHLSRSSTKREHFWRVEYGRGYHHAQSKILFAKKYRGKGVAIKLLVKVLGLALLSMFVLWLRPRYFARLVGRISGLIALWMRG